MRVDPDKSLVKQLRDAAMHETRQKVKIELKDVADRLQLATTTFVDKPNSSNLIQLNALWSRGSYLLGLAYGPIDPTDHYNIAVAA